MDKIVRKKEFAGMLAERLGCSEFEAYKALNAVLRSIQDAIRENHRVVLTGFGTFEVRETAARRIRPIAELHTGNLVELPARRCAKFTAGSELKKIALNQQK